jgi:acetaldehyde dehydrogenase / alcohol dehydrogenase
MKTFSIMTVAKIQIAKKAQREFAQFSQKQVDHIFKFAATSALKQSECLAKLAVKETEMGVVEHKYLKNKFASKTVFEMYEKEKTCGVIHDDPHTGIRRIAHPMGVIAGIIPCTNPTSTAIFKSLIALKTRNALVASAHPRALHCTTEAIRIVNDAAVSAGAPDGLLAVLEEATVPSSTALMKHKDIAMILATGGPAMVTSAYSSGHPAIGVGSGNAPAVIDSTADIKNAVRDIILSKTFDNSVLCPSEQSVFIQEVVYDKVVAEFRNHKAYFTTPKETDMIRRIILKDGKLNPKIVGRNPQYIASLAGLFIPPDTSIIACEVKQNIIGIEEPLSYEKLSPILAFYRVPDYHTAVSLAAQQVEFGGMGHTSVLHTHPENSKNIELFQDAVSTCRILLNQPSTQGALGYEYNRAWLPSLMMGCGTWGNTSYSGNITPSLLLNIKTVIARRQGNEASRYVCPSPY